MCVLPVVYRPWASVRLAHLKDWFYPWVPDSVFSAGKGVSSVDAWYATSIDIEEILSHTRHSDFHVFVADVVKSFNTVDRDILDCALSRLGLPAWFRWVFFSFHKEVRLRFKLATGLGLLGGVMGAFPKDALLVWSSSLRSMLLGVGIWSHLLVSLLNSMLIISSVFFYNVDSVLAAAQFSVSYVHAVGQEASPSKCVCVCYLASLRLLVGA